MVGVDGVGAGEGVDELTGGVGDVGVGDDEPPEQAEVTIAINKRALRNGIHGPGRNRPSYLMR